MAAKSAAKPSSPKRKKAGASRQVLAAGFGLAALYIVVAHAAGVGSVASSASVATRDFVRALQGR